MKIITPTIWSNSPKMEVVRPPKDKLCITTQEGHHLLIKQDITCLIADGNYTIICINEQKIICSQTLSSVFNKINLPPFIRLHKSSVVNMDKVLHIDTSYSSLTTRDGIKLPIARSRKQEIKKVILNNFD